MNGETLAFEQNLSRALRIPECAEAVCHRVAMEASQQADQEAEEADRRKARWKNFFDCSGDNGESLFI